MRFIFLIVSYVVFGSSEGIDRQELCFGSSASLPNQCAPSLYLGPLYFTPRNGGQKKLLMDNTQAKDPRIKIKTDSVVLTQLTEVDDGSFSISGASGNFIDVLDLKILDCATEFSKIYGEDLEYKLPQDFEILEFTAFHQLQDPLFLWTATYPFGGKVQIRKRDFRLPNLTQADSGFYNFRKEDKTLVKRLRLSVQGNTSYYDGDLKASVFIAYPKSSGAWTVNFYGKDGENVTVIQAGVLKKYNNPFLPRIQLLKHGFKIHRIQNRDSGIFEFRDVAGNLALTSHLTIVESHHSVTYTVIAAVCALSGVLYCLCRKRRCCKNTSTTTAQPVQTTPGITTYYHDANEPVGPEYSAAAYPPQITKDVVPPEPAPAFPGPVGGNQPPGAGYFAPPYPAMYPPQTGNAVVSNEPTMAYSGPVPAGPGFYAPSYPAAFPPPLGNVGISHDAAAAPSGPVGFHPVNMNMNISQTEMTPPTREPCAPASSFGSDYPASDTQLSFELKGLNLPSDLPLSTESPSTNVNKPNEFNFL